MAQTRFSPFVAVVMGFAWLIFHSHGAFAAPVHADTAAAAFKGWLHINGRPLGNTLSTTIKTTEAVKDPSGNAAYYVVHLDPHGYAIVSADDRVEPIVAFSAHGEFDPLAADTAAWLVNRDLPRRVARVRAGVADAAARKVRAKWKRLLLGGPGDSSPPDSETNGNIVTVSQVWVAPFLQTLWNQTTDQSGNFACYNYFTPPGPNGDANNDPCGCVATALAQEMYYFQYPMTGVGAHTFPISVNGAATTGTLRGGDGSGGPYQWSNMPFLPNVPALAQAEAVGALVYDAGVAVSMDYGSGASSASFYLAQQALTNVFQFSSASYDEDDNNGLSGTSLLAMIDPSLDARLPVLLGIEPDSGHCLVVDGYGYSSSTLFHHLNTGWGGDNDIWYALPAIDTSDSGDFTMVMGCIYNVYASGAGEIIGGRVTDPTGAPISGASITASQMGGGTYTATTDSNGIYALARLPSASDYTLTVTNAGDAPASGASSTGTSTYNGSCGNVWGANFVLSPPLLAMPETGFSALGPVGGPFSAYSQVFVLTNTSAASVNWTLANSNSWLSATSTSGTVAAGGASILTISLSAAANSLAAGTNHATLWITNLGNHLAQPVPFTLTVEKENADYPISVSGYNQDVVVESGAVGGNSTLYATAFDPENAIFFGDSLCFYENGLVATNLQGGMAAEGLPPGGLLTSAVDHATTFQLGPYTSGNVLYLTPGASSAALTLSAPAAYKSLSVLAASADGGGNGSLVIHFADGSSNSPISFNAGDYFVFSGAPAGTAISRFGVEVTGDGSEFLVSESSSSYPALYQTSIDLQSLGLHTRAITSVSFTMPGGPAATGIFALSGTASPFPVITAQPQSVSAAPGAEVSLSVGAVGAGTLNYRWLFDGSALPGGQGNPLNLTNAGAANAGSYQVIVTNTSGSVTSLVAVLSITSLPLSFVTGANALQYSAGKFMLQLTNLPGQGQVVIAASTNLLQWVPVFTNPPGLGTFTYTDSAAGTFPLRFYRAVTP